MCLTFIKDFEVKYDPNNVVVVDVNEDKVTLALFKRKKLYEIYRIETGLSRLTIAYSGRRRRITRGRSMKIRSAKKALRKLRERYGRHDIIYKTARIIEELATRNNSIIVVGKVHKGKKKFAEKTAWRKLRHRIHQWSVSTLVEILNNKPVHVAEISEAHTSSTNPFTHKPIRYYKPSMIRIAVRGEEKDKSCKDQAETS